MSQHVNAPSASISATTTSARTAYPASPLSGVEIVNLGSATVYVASGDSTVTATTANRPVHPNWPRIFYRKPEDTHLAAITSTGTATVVFVPCGPDEYA